MLIFVIVCTTCITFILVPLRSLSLKPILFGYKTPPIRFSQAGRRTVGSQGSPPPTFNSRWRHWYLYIRWIPPQEGALFGVGHTLACQAVDILILIHSVSDIAVWRLHGFLRKHYNFFLGKYNYACYWCFSLAFSSFFLCSLSVVCLLLS